MDNRGIRPAVWWGVAGSLGALAIGLALLQVYRSSQSAQATRRAAEAPLASSPESHSAATSEATKQPPAAQDLPIKRTPPAEQEPVPYVEGLVFGDIDLREAREVMPDNLYWKLGAPTKDPAVLEAREQEKVRRNQEYGKVLSGDASEEEVRAYYDYRTKLSTDYLEFADFMNRRFEGSLSDEFKGMLELSIKLHNARLARIPAELEDALERSRERAKIREEWRKQQEEFGDQQPATAPNDPASNR